MAPDKLVYGMAQREIFATLLPDRCSDPEIKFCLFIVKNYSSLVKMKIDKHRNWVVDENFYH